ncbi:cytochrome P450 3A19-like [Pomacea canaliculata]|nr:cytochrome P450 3A19-like [Pomacea canaliculata]
MYPAVNIVNRLASETVTIKGVTIPKGAGVLIPIVNVLNDPEYFPEPDKFIPERFSEENKGSRNPMAFLSFGYGPRLCIGMRLALLEIKIAMVHVLRAVKFIKTDDLQGKIGILPGTLVSTADRPVLLKAELRD